MDIQGVTKHISVSDNKNHKWPQICIITIVSLAALSASAQYTWPSPSIPRLLSNTSNESVTLSIEEASYFSVLQPIGTLLASPLIAILMDSTGRKKIIWFISVPHIVAWLLITFSNSLPLFYISRVVSGVGDSVLFGVVPAYIGEIALPEVRGTWGNLITIFIYIGQFLMNIIGAYFSIKITSLIFLIFPILHIILFAFAPESPYYLITKNRTKDAEDSLRLLRWNDNVKVELHSIIKDVQRQISESGTLKDLFSVPVNRKALLISVAVRGCQILSGFPAFAVYTQYIFSLSGGELSSSTSAIIYTGSLLLMSTIWAFFVDRFGRRSLMIFSSIGCAIALLVEAVYFTLMLKTNIDVTSFSWIPLAGMIGYIIACSSGLALLPTLILSELFSSSVKGKAAGVVNVCFQVYLIGIPKLFQFLTSKFGLHVPFFVFFFCTCLSVLFSYFFMPETRQKTLEEIQQMLAKKKTKCDIETTKF